MGEMPTEIEREIGNLLGCARDTSPTADMLARDLRAAILRALADARRQALEEATRASTMKRFTAYRRNISQRKTHSALHKNADHEPQYEGVIWTDGTVTLRWLTPMRSHSVWASLRDALEIHGHPEYGTEIVWHDSDPPREWIDIVARAAGRAKKEPS